MARKTQIEELVIFGGEPGLGEPLHVNRPNLADRAGFSRRVDEVLDRRWFTNDGPVVAELERRLAAYLGTRHCVLTSNGTLGLMLLSHVLGLEGEVIVPSLTFVATAHAFRWQGIEPVFCDVDPETWNLDPAACERLISERTSAIVGVHLWGRPCAIEELAALAAHHSLRLIFDAAHAIGCSYRGAMIGGFGDAEVFSFHATKALHTFEGGAIATNDDALGAKVRLLRNFGFTGYDEVSTLGINAKMPEVCAAMGLANLESIEKIVAANRRTHESYARRLADLPGLSLLTYDPGERHNHHYVVVEVDEEAAGLCRDELLTALHREQVFARRYFYPGCHRLEPYASPRRDDASHLPVTERLLERVLVLPGGGDVAAPQIDVVCDLLRLMTGHAASVRAALAASVAPSGPRSVPLTERRATVGAVRRADATPRLELRVPISPTAKDLRMLRYLLESLQMFGGPIGRAAHCVASVGADEPPRDLAREYPWTARHSVEFQWLDRELFRRQGFDATGFHRFGIASQADVVALIDVDLLVAGDFDRAVLRAHREQSVLGFIAHVSPFHLPELRHIPSHRWWSWIFEEAGLPRPELRFEHTGWGLMYRDPLHRRCPAYYNYGFLIAPRVHVEDIATTYTQEIESVDRVVETWFKSQIANSLAFARHTIPCGTLPLNYNFPLHVSGEGIRALNPDPEGEDSVEDIRIFHYLGEGEVNRDHFSSLQSVAKLLQRDDLTPAAEVFQRKLRLVHEAVS